MGCSGVVAKTEECVLAPVTVAATALVLVAVAGQVPMVV